MIRKEKYKKKWDQCHREREKEVLIPDAAFYKMAKKQKNNCLTSKLRNFCLISYY